MLNFLSRLLATLVLLGPLGAAASLSPVNAVEGFTEYRLPNGLQVLLAPDDSKPTTTVNLTYRVGSRHENYGETGMAHLLEHLLFKGSKRHPLAWAEFNKRGLSANGSTSFDRTNYFASFAANEVNLNWYLDWLADSMTQAFIARKDLDTEMTVVRNEWEMGENSPERVLWEKLMASHYQWHNYGKTTIGARADVENVAIERLQAFYRTYYQPDNATLIVTGKFLPDAVLATVVKTFGAIPKPKRVLPKLYTLEPPQDGERQVTLRRSGGTPQLMAMYHSAPGAHPDHAAMELLGLIMAEAPSGRLHKRLVDGNLAAAVWSWAAAMHDPGFAAFGATLAPTHDEAKARAALLDTLESLATQPVTAEELERARAKYLKSWDLLFSNSEQVGVAISDSVALGDWRLFFLIRDRVKAASLTEVQRVAQQRLIPSNRSLGIYVPTEQPVRAPAPAFVDVQREMTSFVPGTAKATVAPFDTSPANIDARTQRGRLAGPAAGVQFALLSKPTRGQTVNVALTLRGGRLQTYEGRAEAAFMMAAMLDKGGAGFSRQQVSDRLDALKTQLSIGFNPAEPGAFVLRLNSQREHVNAALELVTAIMKAPSFEPAVLEELKRQAASEIESARKEPEAVLEQATQKHLNRYVRGDIRYPRSFEERLEDIRAIQVDALRQLHGQVLGASQAELAAVGDFDVESFKAAAQVSLGGWTTAVSYERVPFLEVPARPGRLSFKTPDKQNAAMTVTLPLALNETDADFAALTMATYLLGNGGNSRLWTRIREKEGLSYSVYAGIAWDSLDRNSSWTGGAIFAPGNRAKVEAAFLEEVERVRAQGFSAKELSDGKQGLLNFRALSRAQDANLAAAWARNLHLQRSFARAAQVDAQIKNLSLAQINEVFRKYVRPEQFLWGFAGDFKD